MMTPKEKYEKLNKELSETQQQIWTLHNREIDLSVKVLKATCDYMLSNSILSECEFKFYYSDHCGWSLSSHKDRHKKLSELFNFEVHSNYQIEDGILFSADDGYINIYFDSLEIAKKFIKKYEIQIRLSESIQEERDRMNKRIEEMTRVLSIEKELQDINQGD